MESFLKNLYITAYMIFVAIIFRIFSRNGCVQQIIRVIESVEANIQKIDFDGKGREYRPNHVVVALLDCSKAFDCMSRPILLDILYKNGVRVRLFDFICGFFFERFQRVRVGQACSEYAQTTHGGPQGSVITLFCWLLYINSICSLISDSKLGYLWMTSFCGYQILILKN